MKADPGDSEAILFLWDQGGAKPSGLTVQLPVRLLALGALWSLCLAWPMSTRGPAPNGYKVEVLVAGEDFRAAEQWWNF